ncbi:substrate-binding domain-containing protein [Streptomyces sviceus]|uniref:Transcriptional regulator n=1 Tax=Streptomyces sviceus (strain ATCC 29083 / DSM 924 / JCM 4929 / NBRC 13980 / NCIMB 11184 / NRRL 5439 / UC 5370) TaxID=463191 RepID=D6XC91_STRX2|nr:transcriptional regulator [Streptomyces sviceus ATCC 29083]
MAARPAIDDAGRGTHTLGLLYPPAGRLGEYTTMQLAFVGGVAEAAAEQGYDLLLAPAGRHGDPSFPRMVDDRRVDGVIVMEIRREDDRVAYLAEAGFPFVAIGRNHRADVAGWVDLDFAGLAGGCVQHLADLGHRRIAFVNRSEQLFNSGYGFARLGDEGYTETMKKLLLTPHAYLCGDDLASGEEVVERILSEDPATTSLVTMNEAALEGVYRGLTRNGRTVPRDFSVVGVAASPWARTGEPAPHRRRDTRQGDEPGRRRPDDEAAALTGLAAPARPAETADHPAREHGTLPVGAGFGTRDRTPRFPRYRPGFLIRPFLCPIIEPLGADDVVPRRPP